MSARGAATVRRVRLGTVPPAAEEYAAAQGDGECRYVPSGRRKGRPVCALFSSTEEVVPRDGGTAGRLRPKWPERGADEAAACRPVSGGVSGWAV